MHRFWTRNRRSGGDVGLRTALYLHYEIASVFIGTAEIDQRGLVRKGDARELGGGIFEVGDTPVLRQEDIEEADKFSLVRRVAEQGLEPRIGKRIHIHRH